MGEGFKPMAKKYKVSESKRITEMAKKVCKKCEGQNASVHLLGDWEKIKNKDLSVLEGAFSTMFYLLFTRGKIPTPVGCIFEVTEGEDCSGAKKETVELYFYLDPDAEYRHFKVGEMVNT